MEVIVVGFVLRRKKVYLESLGAYFPINYKETNYHSSLKSVWRNERQAFELYQITNDPGETADLARQEPARFQEMIKYWKSWRGSVDGSSKGGLLKR